MKQRTNPWADVANEAVGALYKNYMSKPNPGDLEKNHLERQLLQSRIGTEGARQTKIGHEATGLEMRNSAPSEMAELLGAFMNDQPVAPQVQQSPTAPLSVRNNNPGNMRPVGASEGFQGFATPQEGLDAMRKDLMIKINGDSNAMKANYGDGYEPSLANLIATWAPSSENDTNNYVNFVSSETGIAPDRPLNESDLAALMPAMIAMEGGQEASNYYQAESPQVVQPEPAGDISAAYSKYIPGIVEQAMSASLLSPGQSGDVMQMIGGALQLPPEMMGNLQLGAGGSYANTEQGYDEKLQNNLDVQRLRNEDESTFKPEAIQYRLQDGSTVQGVFSGGQYLQSDGVTPMPMEMVQGAARIGSPTGTNAELGFGKAANNSLDKQTITLDGAMRSINEAKNALQTETGEFWKSTGISGSIAGADIFGIMKQLPVFEEAFNVAGLQEEDMTRIKVNRSKMEQTINEVGRFIVNGPNSDRFSDADKRGAEDAIAILKAGTTDAAAMAIMTGLENTLKTRLEGVNQLREGGPSAAGQNITPDDIDNMSEAELDAFLAGQ